MPRHKKLKTKELKHDPFRQWFDRQIEWVRRHRQQIRRISISVGVVATLLIALMLAYSGWTSVAQHRLAFAFDVFNAQVGDDPTANAFQRAYKTDDEKYRQALEAFRQVSQAWYFRFSEHRETALYYEALCQLQLNASEGQTLLERLGQGDSTTAKLARVGLANHLIGQNDAARAEAIYKHLTEDPGSLPKAQIQLGLAQAFQLQGKKDEAVALYLEIAKEQTNKPEGREAITRLANLDPAALDQIPEDSIDSAPPDPLSRYSKK